MKLLKKISLVYTLQVLAVILLFSYAGSSSGRVTNGQEAEVILPGTIHKDSMQTGSTNSLWKINAGKNR
jgi:hypothetical protein